MVYCNPAFEAWTYMDIEVMAYIHAATAKVCIHLRSTAIVVLGHSLAVLDKSKFRTVPRMHNMDKVGEHNTSQVVDPLDFVAGALLQVSMGTSSLRPSGEHR
ncbi:hypothetical protein RIF29_21506 [Crotalaria pallida]|uniref:Uncharacterized protein n=1 Tax=Crotalaria pallida TaxID=3830 RepID=A0AAN9F337_CROPI